VTTLRLDPDQETRKANGDIIKPGTKGRQPKGGGPIWYQDAKRQDEDIEIEKMVLDVVNETKQARDLRIEDVIVDGEIDRTMDGASTFRITLHDPDRKLLNSPSLRRAIDLNLDGLWFRLVRIEKQGSLLTLEFEDRMVAHLRSHNKVQRAQRTAKFTRLEFCLRLVRSVKKDPIPVVCPELHIKQPTKRLAKKDRKAVARDVTLPGINADEHLTVKGAKATRKQIQIVEWVLEKCEQENANKKMMLAALMTITQESGITPGLRDYASGIHVGIFQQDSTPGSYWNQQGGGYIGGSEKGIKGNTHAFLTAARNVYAENRNIDSAELAYRVQNPGGGNGQYAQWKKEAERWLEAWGGSSDKGGGEITRTFRKKYTFTTEEGNKKGGKPLNYWDAIGALLEETNFRRFVSNGFLYLISDDQLFRGKVRMILTHDTPGVTEINFTHDVEETESTATVTCRAARWVAPPGTIVKLTHCGAANGKWLVESIRRNIYSRDCEITLKKPDPKLPEPASDIKTVTVGSDAALGGPIHGWPAAVSAMYRKAKRINDAHYPYVWGGGHGEAGKPDHGSPGSYNDSPTAGNRVGYDCSGSTAAVLNAGGLMSGGVPGSGEFGHCYKGATPGRGKFITIWYHSGHVFIEFYKNGERDADPPLYGPWAPGEGDSVKTLHFGTGRWGKSWTGPGFNPQLHPKAGFSSSHPHGF
jgi:hypothetical protein